MIVGVGEKLLEKKILLREYVDLLIIEEVVGEIFKVMNLVILVGSGVICSNFVKVVIEFVSKLKIFVINIMMVKGIILFDNKYVMWIIGIL